MSEGSVFKRFATKEELFREALGLPDVRVGAELGELLEEGTIEEGLERVGLRLIELFRDLLPRMMMLWANMGPHARSPLEALQCVEGGVPMPLLMLRTLSAHLEKQQRKGRLRDVDPEILARLLLGSTHNFAFFEIVGVNDRQPLVATSFVRSMVDVFMQGVRAPAISSTGED